MELFESNKPYPDQKQTTLPVEPEPRYQPTAASQPTEPSEHGQSLIRIIGLVLFGLVLVIAIVLMARWTYHRIHHNRSTNGYGNASNSSKLSDAADKLAAGSGNSLQNSSPSSPNNSSSTGKTATPPPAGNPKISNAGPGNVVGLFVGTSLAAAGLHFVVSMRRFNRA